MINLNDLSDGNRICVFIRHGEKNINDFGLTDKGIQDTITFAKLLCSINKKIVIISLQITRICGIFIPVCVCNLKEGKINEKD